MMRQHPLLLLLLIIPLVVCQYAPGLPEEGVHAGLYSISCVSPGSSRCPPSSQIIIQMSSGNYPRSHNTYDAAALQAGSLAQTSIVVTQEDFTVATLSLGDGGSICTGEFSAGEFYAGYQFTCNDSGNITQINMTAVFNSIITNDITAQYSRISCDDGGNTMCSQTAPSFCIASAGTGGNVYHSTGGGKFYSKIVVLDDASPTNCLVFESFNVPAPFSGTIMKCSFFPANNTFSYVVYGMQVTYSFESAVCTLSYDNNNNNNNNMQACPYEKYSTPQEALPNIYQKECYGGDVVCANFPNKITLGMARSQMNLDCPFSEINDVNSINSPLGYLLTTTSSTAMLFYVNETCNGTFTQSMDVYMFNFTSCMGQSGLYTTDLAFYTLDLSSVTPPPREGFFKLDTCEPENLCSPKSEIGFAKLTKKDSQNRIYGLMVMGQYMGKILYYQMNDCFLFDTDGKTLNCTSPATPTFTITVNSALLSYQSYFCDSTFIPERRDGLVGTYSKSCPDAGDVLCPTLPDSLIIGIYTELCNAFHSVETPSMTYFATFKPMSTFSQFSLSTNNLSCLGEIYGLNHTVNITNCNSSPVRIEYELQPPLNPIYSDFSGPYGAMTCTPPETCNSVAKSLSLSIVDSSSNIYNITEWNNFKAQLYLDINSNTKCVLLDNAPVREPFQTNIKLCTFNQTEQVLSFSFGNGSFISYKLGYSGCIGPNCGCTGPNCSCTGPNCGCTGPNCTQQQPCPYSYYNMETFKATNIYDKNCNASDTFCAALPNKIFLGASKSGPDSCNNMVMRDYYTTMEIGYMRAKSSFEIEMIGNFNCNGTYTYDSGNTERLMITFNKCLENGMIVDKNIQFQVTSSLGSFSYMGGDFKVTGCEEVPYLGKCSEMSGIEAKIWSQSNGTYNQFYMELKQGNSSQIQGKFILENGPQWYLDYDGRISNAYFSPNLIQIIFIRDNSTTTLNLTKVDNGCTGPNCECNGNCGAPCPYSYYNMDTTRATNIYSKSCGDVDAICTSFSSKVFLLNTKNAPDSCKNMAILDYTTKTGFGFVRPKSSYEIELIGNVSCNGTYYFVDGNQEQLVFTFTQCLKNGTLYATNMTYKTAPLGSYADMSGSFFISSCVETPYLGKCSEITTSTKSVTMVSGGGDKGAPSVYNQYYMLIVPVNSTTNSNNNNGAKGKFILETSSQWYLDNDGSVSTASVTKKMFSIVLKQTNSTIVLNITTSCLATIEISNRGLLAGRYNKTCTQSAAIDPFCPTFNQDLNLGILGSGCPVSYASNPLDNKIFGRIALINSTHLSAIGPDDFHVFCNGTYSLDGDAYVITFKSCETSNGTVSTLTTLKQILPTVTAIDASGQYILTNCAINHAINASYSDTCDNFPEMYKSLVLASLNSKNTIYNVTVVSGYMAGKMVISKLGASNNATEGWNYPYSSPPITTYAYEQFIHFSGNSFKLPSQNLILQFSRSIQCSGLSQASCDLALCDYCNSTCYPKGGCVNVMECNLLTKETCLLSTKNCTYCSSFDACTKNPAECSCSFQSSMGACQKFPSTCSWCGGNAKCVEKNMTCPLCSSFNSSDVCLTAIGTNGFCSFCRGKCANLCSTCSAFAVGTECTSNGCLSCGSSCVEISTGCPACQSITTEVCSNSTEGMQGSLKNCKWCGNSLCTSSECPACSTYTGKTECNSAANNKCKFCWNQKCIPTGTSCFNCSTTSNSSCVNEGCTYCGYGNCLQPSNSTSCPTCENISEESKCKASINNCDYCGNNICRNLGKCPSCSNYTLDLCGNATTGTEKCTSCWNGQCAKTGKCLSCSSLSNSSCTSQGCTYCGYGNCIQPPAVCESCSVLQKFECLASTNNCSWCGNGLCANKNSCPSCTSFNTTSSCVGALGCEPCFNGKCSETGKCPKCSDFNATTCSANGCNWCGYSCKQEACEDCYSIATLDHCVNSTKNCAWCPQGNGSCVRNATECSCSIYTTSVTCSNNSCSWCGSFCSRIGECPQCNVLTTPELCAESTRGCQFCWDNKCQDPSQPCTACGDYSYTNATVCKQHGCNWCSQGSCIKEKTCPECAVLDEMRCKTSVLNCDYCGNGRCAASGSCPQCNTWNLETSCKSGVGCEWCPTGVCSKAGACVNCSLVISESDCISSKCTYCGGALKCATTFSQCEECSALTSELDCTGSKKGCNWCGGRCAKAGSCPTCSAINSSSECSSSVFGCQYCWNNKCAPLGQCLDCTTLRSSSCESLGCKYCGFGSCLNPSDSCPSCDKIKTPLDCKSSTKACSWCGQTCASNSTCPSCSEITDQISCSLSTSSCDWCTSGKCLQKGSCLRCANISTEPLCNEYKCSWCGDSCQTPDIPCPSCTQIKSSSSCTSSINACSWCTSAAVCANKAADCDCSLKSEANCNSFMGCAYCGNNVCIKQGSTCPSCATLASESECKGSTGDCKWCWNKKCTDSSEPCTNCTDYSTPSCTNEGCTFCGYGNCLQNNTCKTCEMISNDDECRASLRGCEVCGPQKCAKAGLCPSCEKIVAKDACNLATRGCEYCDSSRTCKNIGGCLPCSAYTDSGCIAEKCAFCGYGACKQNATQCDTCSSIVNEFDCKSSINNCNWCANGVCMPKDQCPSCSTWDTETKCMNARASLTRPCAWCWNNKCVDKSKQETCLNCSAANTTTCGVGNFAACKNCGYSCSQSECAECSSITSKNKCSLSSKNCQWCGDSSSTPCASFGSCPSCSSLPSKTQCEDSPLCSWCPYSLSPRCQDNGTCTNCSAQTDKASCTSDCAYCGNSVCKNSRAECDKCTSFKSEATCADSSRGCSWCGSSCVDQISDCGCSSSSSNACLSNPSCKYCKNELCVSNSSSCPSCDYWMDSSSCTIAGCNWSRGKCKSEVVECTTYSSSSSCESDGCIWCGSGCSASVCPSCPTIISKTACESSILGCEYCGNSVCAKSGSCPSCSKWNSSAFCSDVPNSKCTWCNDHKCKESASCLACSLLSSPSCVDEGCKWCGFGSCKGKSESCPTCTSLANNKYSCSAAVNDTTLKYKCEYCSNGDCNVLAAISSCPARVYNCSSVNYQVKKASCEIPTEGKCKWCLGSCISSVSTCTPPTFALKTAQIDPSGTYVIVKFTSGVPTSVLSLGVDCSSYFTSDTIPYLGESPKCKWEGNNLKVVLGNGADIYQNVLGVKTSISNYFTGSPTINVDDMGYFDPISVSIRVSGFQCDGSDLYAIFDASASTGPGKLPLDLSWIDMTTEETVSGTRFVKKSTELNNGLVVVLEAYKFATFIQDLEIPQVPNQLGGLMAFITGIQEGAEIPSQETQIIGSSVKRSCGSSSSIEYSWILDDNLISSDNELRLSVAAPGQHTLQLWVNSSSSGDLLSSASVSFFVSLKPLSSSLSVSPSVSVAAFSEKTISINVVDPSNWDEETTYSCSYSRSGDCVMTDPVLGVLTNPGSLFDPSDGSITICITAVKFQRSTTSCSTMVPLSPTLPLVSISLDKELYAPQDKVRLTATIENLLPIDTFLWSVFEPEGFSLTTDQISVKDLRGSALVIKGDVLCSQIPCKTSDNSQFSEITLQLNVSRGSVYTTILQPILLVKDPVAGSMVITTDPGKTGVALVDTFTISLLGWKNVAEYEFSYKSADGTLVYLSGSTGAVNVAQTTLPAGNITIYGSGKNKLQVKTSIDSVVEVLAVDPLQVGPIVLDALTELSKEKSYDKMLDMVPMMAMNNAGSAVVSAARGAHKRDTASDISASLLDAASKIKARLNSATGMSAAEYSKKISQFKTFFKYISQDASLNVPLVTTALESLLLLSQKASNDLGKLVPAQEFADMANTLLTSYSILQTHPELQQTIRNISGITVESIQNEIQNFVCGESAQYLLSKLRISNELSSTSELTGKKFVIGNMANLTLPTISSSSPECFRMFISSLPSTKENSSEIIQAYAKDTNSQSIGLSSLAGSKRAGVSTKFSFTFASLPAKVDFTCNYRPDSLSLWSTTNCTVTPVAPLSVDCICPDLGECYATFVEVISTPAASSSSSSSDSSGSNYVPPSKPVSGDSSSSSLGGIIGGVVGGVVGAVCVVGIVFAVMKVMKVMKHKKAQARIVDKDVAMETISVEHSASMVIEK